MRDWLTHAAVLTRGVLLVLFHCRFDAATGDVRYCVDPETQLQVPYCPQVWPPLSSQHPNQPCRILLA